MAACWPTGGLHLLCNLPVAPAPRSLPSVGAPVIVICSISGRTGPTLANNKVLSGSSLESSHPGRTLFSGSRGGAAVLTTPAARYSVGGVPTAPARLWLPITPSILRRVSASLKSQDATWDRLMIWADMNLCFFGFLHSGEICYPTTTQFDKTCQLHLMPSDLTVDNHANPTRLSVCIKALKTDPFRRGITLVLDATQRDLCPLPVILPYVAVWGAAPSPLFQMANGAFLTQERFVKEVRSLLRLAGLDL